MFVLQKDFVDLFHVFSQKKIIRKELGRNEHTLLSHPCGLIRSKEIFQDFHAFVPLLKIISDAFQYVLIHHVESSNLDLLSVI